MYLTLLEKASVHVCITFILEKPHFEGVCMWEPFPTCSPGSECSMGVAVVAVGSSGRGSSGCSRGGCVRVCNHWKVIASKVS